MKSLATLLWAALIFLGSSCASNNSWDAENVPYPKTTPFDSNEFARRAFLDGFRTGYQSEKAGSGTPVDILAPPYLQARRLGFHAGTARARSEESGQSGHAAPAKP